MTIWTTGAGPVGAANRSQATPTTASVTHSLARRADSLCLNVMPISRCLAPNPLGADHDVVEVARSEEHTSELQSRLHLVCRLLLEKKKIELLDKATSSTPKLASHLSHTQVLLPTQTATASFNDLTSERDAARSTSMRRAHVRTGEH